ncbi:secreted protein containing Prepilin-type cleavage/methylation [Rhodopirellula maiorica SM1]|uniref:Secreted protein containing Prepilin-type cleavage/methylation n=1 Tax=Rhodopirellula maiorica SM1 TaxID=1265738 RepID=M5RQI9_9BACT|nr:prepilin-type N-terminal cleavage/methylation domain-containing protein [Rhodopirellula maiorica]EMI21476.1 secreted protein containing Prepilin-type cleavage/methylation [Rhodopirellula maiorica SM1]
MFKKRRWGRKGFTLVELVVVVLILGILAAVAAPRMFDTAGNARDNATRQSLVVIRDAIDLYKAQTGEYPELTSLTTDLKPYLQGAFPATQVGSDPGAGVVAGTSPLSTATDAGGWIYDEATGEFCVNDTDYITKW